MKSLRFLHLIVSALLLLAIFIVLNFLVKTRPDFSETRFFCYFTNQSNILVALFFILESFMLIPRPVYDRTRGALILYMTMTSSIYWLFLNGLVHLDSTLAYASNAFLHSGALALLIYDLLRNRPETRIGLGFIGIWMIYPALYLGGIMMMGRMVGWYPYPFLNIDTLGFASWLMWIGGLGLGIAAIAFGIIRINNRLVRTR